MTVVGIGADGWAGLPEPSRRALASADVLMGSARQLALVPGPAERVPWPSPLLPALPGLLDRHRDRGVCVLASGDPMFFGLGATLHRLLGHDGIRVLPHVSSVSLACARLGWPVDEVAVVSAVGRPLERVHPMLAPDRRLLVLSPDGSTPAALAALLTARGYGPSELTVLARLGGPDEHALSGTASTWSTDPVDALHIVAVRCRPEPDAPLLPTVPGLPDAAYATDGQLTKRDVRAITLARLAPVPGQLLWDVGAGSGSVGIEWLRSHPSCRAVAVECRADRAERVEANARALGAPGLRVVRGEAPGALAGLPAPDAVFVGGGLTAPGLVEACWAALPAGGRLVANAVTVESEAVLARWYAKVGGELTRIALSRAEPLGGFAGWRAAAPVTQWTVVKR